MDKLRPVLKQIFWVVFSVALMLMLIAWWSAKGELSAAIEKREGEVAQAFTDGTQNVKAVPNDSWTAGGKKINESHLEKYKLSAVQLYRRQLSARTYPVEIEEEMGRIPFNSPIYDKALREHYAVVYPDYFRAQIDAIQPFEYGKGLVDVSEAEITYVTKMRQRPTSPEIWKAQEDIWLLRSVLDSIAAVNDGYERVDKAPLRALLQLKLRGGDRSAAAGAGGGGQANIQALMAAEEAAMMGIDPAFGGGGAGVTSSGPWSPYEGSLSSDLLSEELGSETASRGGGSWSGRYVDDDESLPYRTRAFGLNVKIVEQAIPVLMAELTNSSFPVEILRVDASFGGGGGSVSNQRVTSAASASSGFADMAMASVDESGMYGGGFGGGFGGAPMGGGAELGSVLLGARTERLSAREQKQAREGEQLLAAGLASRDICTVRVAGLMTLYRSQEENMAEIESAAAAADEAREVGAQMPDEGQGDAANGSASAPTQPSPEAGPPGQPDEEGAPNASVDGASESAAGTSGDSVSADDSQEPAAE